VILGSRIRNIALLSGMGDLELQNLKYRFMEGKAAIAGILTP
jgi:hypothetical protein